MVLMQHDGDFAIPRAEHDLDVQADQGPQPLYGVEDAAYGGEHAILCDLHGMVHDLEQNLVLALEMMVKSALAELECGRDVVHRCGVISALLEEAGSGSQDFLPGINQSLASHRVSW